MSSDNPYVGQPGPYGKVVSAGPDGRRTIRLPATAAERYPPEQTGYAFGPFAPRPARASAPGGPPPGPMPGPAASAERATTPGQGLIIVGAMVLWR